VPEPGCPNKEAEDVLDMAEVNERSTNLGEAGVLYALPG